MKRYRLFLAVLIVTFSAAAQAQKTADVDDEMKEFVLSGTYLQILEDTTKKWTIDQVSDSTFKDRFVTNQSNYPYNENTKSAYWIKFKIKNNSKSGKSFLLESYAPHTNNWQVFIPTSDGFQMKQSGLDLYFYNREYINKNLILDLPLDTGVVKTYYARVLSSNHSSFDFRIKPSRYFFFYSTNEYYFLGIYYGIMFIMAIYNLLMFISLKEKVYIYYVLYVCSGILTTLADDGIGYQYVWINIPQINALIGPHIAPIFLLLAFVLYSREFLHLKKKLPLYDKIILGLTAFYLIYFILKNTILPVSFHSHSIYLLPFLLIYASAIHSIISGDKAARIFIIGYTLVLISIFIIKLRSNGTVEGNLFTVYSLNYGLVIEVLVLSFAIAERMRYAKKKRQEALKERNQAQYHSIRQLKINETLKNQINRELEEKVAERTKELQEKNKELEILNVKLKDITDGATKISIKLDVDNWNLQKKVLESIRARMIGQAVSNEEFNKIFPDDTSCFRYLYELKWENGFTCIRCKHHEASDDMKLFAKKCLSCNYVESVTAHTLFHGLKFPINKAFQLIYLSIHSKKTLDELSEIIDLRRNTCWSFKQKITDATDIYKKKNKVDYVKNWEYILLIK
ncbi:MAG: hypothetical protein H7282_10755 [Cytophagaceae bacterium]|nr:hypothetical protein [Cytophagaceae bacterium]